MRTIAIVMGRNYTSRLGMIRAAGQAGCDVIVIKTDPFDKTCKKKDRIDLSSKYVREYHCLREPNDDGLIQLICRRGEQYQGSVILLPTDDYTASVIDMRQADFPERFLYPSIDHKAGAVVRCMDKGFQKELAQKAGLPVAKGWTAKYDEETQSYVIPSDIEFPCFVKPQVSFKGSKLSMMKCDDLGALEKHLSSVVRKKASDVLIEQYIEIEKEYDIPGFADRDKVTLPAFIQKGLIHRGVTGTGTLLDSAQFWETTEQLKRMIGELGFTGLIDIELFESKGRIYFNELNMRFGASGFAMTGSGINLPEMLIQTLLGVSVADGAAAVPSRRSFASEKVCLQEYMSEKISWKAYQKLLEDADFSFIRCEYDPKPYRAFSRFAAIEHTKKRIVKLLRRR